MNKDQYISLIIAKLNGFISLEEEIMLTKWIGQSSENKNIYVSICNTWKETDAYEPIPNIDKQKLWENIENEINSTHSTVVDFKPKNSFSIFKIAATVLLLISAGFLVQQYFGDFKAINITTSENETKEILLPDGSIISMNENSSVVFSKNFSKRKVKLVGEAFFDVTKDVSRPFSVETFTTETFVLGTSFNIKSDKVFTKVSLYTGKVKFSANNNTTILKPGKSVIYDAENKLVVLLKEDITNDISWKTKTLEFNNSKLSDVVSDIEKYYHKDIKIENVKSLDCSFTGKFKDKDFEEVLKAISFSFNSEFDIKGNTVYFNAITCN